jgi:hypothetical protein
MQFGNHVLEESATTIFRVLFCQKIEAAGRFRMVSLYPIAWCNIPEDHLPHKNILSQSVSRLLFEKINKLLYK